MRVRRRSPPPDRGDPARAEAFRILCAALGDTDRVLLGMAIPLYLRDEIPELSVRAVFEWAGVPYRDARWGARILDVFEALCESEVFRD